MCDFGRTESETGLVCESVLKNKETGDGRQEICRLISQLFHLFHMLLLMLNMLLLSTYETSGKELSRLTRLAEGA
jgi:hypothetical protein